ncbi:hypothetical protein D3C78_1883880 [compost metagenome]
MQPCCGDDRDNQEQQADTAKQEHDTLADGNHLIALRDVRGIALLQQLLGLLLERLNFGRAGRFDLLALPHSLE